MDLKTFLRNITQKEKKKMNKIFIDKENVIEIKDNAVALEINSTELTINVKGKVLIQEISKKSNETLNLTINIEPNSSLIYNRFMIHDKIDNKITLNQQNNSSAIFNYSFIANNKCNLILNSNLNGDNNETEIKVKAVTENLGSTNITSTADTKPKILNNNLLESIKILMLNDEESVCVPNLLVSSNEVEVDHAATISGIDENYLFYLNSKGISTVSATKLIKNGYLLSNLDINEEIKKEIEELIGGE